MISDALFAFPVLQNYIAPGTGTNSTPEDPATILTFTQGLPSELSKNLLGLNLHDGLEAQLTNHLKSIRDFETTTTVSSNSKSLVASKIQNDFLKVLQSLDESLTGIAKLFNFYVDKVKDAYFTLAKKHGISPDEFQELTPNWSLIFDPETLDTPTNP